MDFSQIMIIGFDLDQTLYPKSPEIDQAIQKYLFKEISAFRNITVGDAEKMFEGLYQSGKGLSGRRSLIKIGFSEERAHNMVQEALENADIADFLQPNKDVLNLLCKLKEKYVALDIITGSNSKNANKKLEKLKIPSNIFSHIITSDDASKSDLSAYKMWLDYYPDYKSESFLYIGDRASSDFEKPKEMKINSILVNIKTPDDKYDCLQLSSFWEINNYL